VQVNLLVELLMATSEDGCACTADARVKAGGTARKRRLQTRRADARHVDWLLSLQQSRSAHHTAPVGKRRALDSTLEARIFALERALALLLAVEPAEIQADAERSVARGAEPGEEHLIALQVIPATETAPGEVQRIALQARAVGWQAHVDSELHRVAAEQAFAEAAVAEALARSAQRAAAELLLAGQFDTQAAIQVLERMEEEAEATAMGLPVATASAEVQRIALLAVEVERQADHDVELHCVAAEQALAEEEIAEVQALAAQRAASELLLAGHLNTQAAFQVLAHMEGVAATAEELKVLQHEAAPIALAEGESSSEFGAGANSSSCGAPVALSGKRRRKKGKKSPLLDDDGLEQAIEQAREEQALRLASLQRILEERQVMCPGRHAVMKARIATQGRCGYGDCGLDLAGELVAYCPQADCLPNGKSFAVCLRCQPLKELGLHLSG
jgi:hypothetical protein